MALRPLIWKALVAIIILSVLTVQLFRGWSTDNGADEDGEQWPEPKPAPAYGDTDRLHHMSDWVYDVKAHANNYGLTAEQCTLAFPALNYEIRRAASRWVDRPITADTIELWDENEAGLHLLIHDNQLRVISTKGMHRADFRLRISNVLHQIQRAITSVEGVEKAFHDMEFTIVVDDNVKLPEDGSRTVWAFTRDQYTPLHDDIWLIPDFNFWTAPPDMDAFSDVQAKARTHDSALEDKKAQVVWRGVKWTAPKIRGALLSVTRNQPWADVQEVNWNKGTGVIQLEDLCDYRFLVNTEGHSWSSRLTFIFNCDSVPIVHDLRYTTHYYHLLEPDTNYVPVVRDFSNLPRQIERLISRPDDALRIAHNAKAMFRERYTTPAATACYWRQLLRSWSGVAFEPNPMEPSPHGEQPRGIIATEFLLNSTADYPFAEEDQKTNYR